MDQRNLMIAIVLSVAILIAFQFVFERLRPAIQPSGPGGGSSAAGKSTPAAPGTPAEPSGSSAPGALAARAAQDSRGSDRRPAARQDRHAAAARLDRPDRGPDRRSDARHLPRDGRPEEPGSRAVVAARHRGPLSRGIRLGRRDPRRQTARTADPVDRSGGTLTPTSPVTLTWDNGGGLVFTRTIASTRTTCSRSMTRCATPAARRSS